VGIGLAFFIEYLDTSVKTIDDVERALQAPVLGVIFAFFLILEPLVLLGLAAWWMRLWAGGQRPMLALMVRYSYGLVPMGFGMWLAHYGFHFLSGLYTIIPVTQSALESLGWPIFGEPRWTFTGLPGNIVQLIEIGFLFLGFAGALTVTYSLAEEDSPLRPMRARRRTGLYAARPVSRCPPLRMSLRRRGRRRTLPGVACGRRPRRRFGTARATRIPA